MQPINWVFNSKLYQLVVLCCLAIDLTQERSREISGILHQALNNRAKDTYFLSWENYSVRRDMYLV